MKRLSTATLLTLALCLPAAAQDTTALARDYVELDGVQQMMDAMFSADALAAQFMTQIPPSVQISEAQQTEIGALMAATLDAMRPELEEAMVASSAATFTAPELEALIAFYRTEAGGSVMAKMQPMMADFIQRMGPSMAEMQQTLAPQVIAILQAPE